MGRRFSRADDASNPFPRDRVRFGPRMNDEHDHAADHADGLPPLLVRVWVRARRRKRIIEHQLGRLEAEAVSPPVGAVLDRIPSPPKRIGPK